MMTDKSTDDTYSQLVLLTIVEYRPTSPCSYPALSARNVSPPFSVLFVAQTETDNATAKLGEAATSRIGL